MTDSSDAYAQLVRGFSDRLVAAQGPIRILDAIKWDDSVRDAFFEGGFKRLPPVDTAYYEQRPLPEGIEGSKLQLAELTREIESQLGSDDPAGRMMLRMCREYTLVIEMLSARGTPRFHELSAELFGRAADPFHQSGPSLVELAKLLDESLRNLDSTAFGDATLPTIPASEGVAILQERMDAYFARDDMRVQVRLDDGIVADAAAGSDYIKLRADARFRPSDLRVLEVHEGWVHVGTTLSGRAQPWCTFLSKGTPSTTITQEGLALFIELISFSAHPRRLRRVTDRIRAIHWAENGAHFLEVFERFLAEGRTPIEAYPTCVRVFRGSTPTGGPFNKDLAYSRGFIEVYNFVRLAVRRGRLDRVRLLFCGKLTLGDMRDLALLHERQLVSSPVYLPPQLAEPAGLTAWMAYSNFLNRLDLKMLEDEMLHLLE